MQLEAKFFLLVKIHYFVNNQVFMCVIFVFRDQNSFLGDPMDDETRKNRLSQLMKGGRSSSKSNSQRRRRATLDSDDDEWYEEPLLKKSRNDTTSG